MFRTGTTARERVAVAESRVMLLSRYNPEWTLAKYVSYYDLLDIIEASEKAFLAASAAAASAGGTAAAAVQPNFSAFFERLKLDFLKVRDHLVETEREASALLSVIRDSRLSDLQKKPQQQQQLDNNDAHALLVSAYIQLCKIAEYRAVNGECFRRLFERVMQGPAGQRSLELQEKLRLADKIVSKSAVGTAAFDVDVARDLVCSVYGLASSKSYEEATAALTLALRRDPACQPRVLPLSGSYYYLELNRSRYVQGHFATRLVTGTSSEALGRDVEALMSMPSVRSNIGRFSNGEVSITFDEPVRGDDVFVLQSVSSSASSRGGKSNYSLSAALMELLLLVQTVKQASAKRVTAVVPFLPYNHRQAEGSLIAEFLEHMGADCVVTVDMGREQVCGFFTNAPVHNISMMPEFTRFLQRHLELVPRSTEIVVVAPDGDSLKRAKMFADELSELCQRDVALATAVKSPTMLAAEATRAMTNMCAGNTTDAAMMSMGTNYNEDPSSPMNLEEQARAAAAGVHPVDIIGKTAGRVCILVDTLIDEGTKMVQVARTLREQGAVSVIAVATHALFSGDATESIVHAPIDMLVVSDSIAAVVKCARDPRLALKLRIVPMAPLLAQAIQRIHADTVITTKVLD